MEISSKDLGMAANQPQVAHFILQENDIVHMLHPKQIIAFQGAPSLREDRLYNLKGMYRKRKLIRSKLTGPSNFLVALPPGFYLKTIHIDRDSDFMFEFRHLLFFTEGIEMRNTVQKFKNMLVTKDLIRTRFTGTGTIGILSNGPLYEAELDPDEPLYVDAKCLVAYPHNAKLELCVYGNHMASQNMNYHWKMTGHGTALLQASKSDKQLEQEMDDDTGFIKRVLREVIPFGGIIIK